MKFCIKCGHELPDSAQFCAYCGTMIPRSEEANEPHAKAVMDYDEEEGAASLRRKRGKILLYIAAGMVAVFVLVFIAYSLERSRIVGTWKDETWGYSTIEFTSDGKLISSGSNSYQLLLYKLDGDSLIISSGMANAADQDKVVFKYRVDGDKLTLTMDGNSRIFYRDK